MPTAVPRRVLAAVVALSLGGAGAVVALPVSAVPSADPSPADVAIAEPADGAFVRSGASQRFLATVEPTGTRVDVVLEVDAIPVHEASTSIARSYSRPVDTTGWLDGSTHDFTITATDQVGRANRLTVTVTVDAVAPLVAVDSPRRNDVLTGVVDVTGTASDARAGLASLELRVRPYDRTTESCGDPVETRDLVVAGDGSWASELDTATLADGEYCLLARAVDAAGNAASDQVRFVTVDNSAPSGSFTPVFPQGFTLAADRLEWSALTDPHGVVYEVALGDHPNVDADGLMTSGLELLGETSATRLDVDHPTGPGFWQVRARDELGNTTPWTAPIGFQVIGVPVVLAPTPGLVFSGSSLTAEWTPSFGFSGVVRYEIRYGVDRDHDGVLAFEYRSVPGHSGWPVATPSRVQTFPVSSALPAGYEGPLSISVRAIYGQAFGGSVEGPWSEPAVAYVRDTAPPAVTIDAPAGGAVLRGSAPVPATLTATDGGGIGSLSLDLYAADGTTLVATLGTESGALGTTATRTWDIPAGLPNGAYVLAATTVDVAGVVATDTAALVIDRRRPTVSIDVPAAGAAFAGDVTVTVSGADAGGLDRLVANLFSGANTPPRLLRIGAIPAAGDTTASATWTIPVADFPGDGVYTIRARAVDRAGNGRTVTAQVVIDTTGPTAPQPTAPQNGLTRAVDAPVLDWTPVADAVSYEVRTSTSPARTPDTTDGELAGSDAVTIPAATDELALSGLGQGWLWWQVRGVDALGNVGSWSAIWATGVDTVGPAVTLVTPGDGDVLSVADFDLEWAEPEAGATYEVRSSTDPTTDPTTGELTSGGLVAASSTRHAVSGALDGDYVWQVRAIDALGNRGPWSPVRELTVDLPAPSPTPSPSAPPATGGVGGGSVDLTTFALANPTGEAPPSSGASAGGSESPTPSPTSGTTAPVPEQTDSGSAGLDLTWAWILLGLLVAGGLFVLIAVVVRRTREG